MPKTPAGPTLLLAGATIVAWLIRHAFVLSVAAFLLVVVAGIATLTIAERIADADRLVAQTFEIDSVARRLLSDLQDAETGQRGFLLTADDRYLEPFDRAQASVEGTFSALRKLTEDNGAERARLDALRPLIDAKFDELRRTIALQKAGKPADALAMVKSNKGKDLMDAIRAAIAVVSQTAHDLLQQRQASAAGYRAWLFVLVAFSLIASTGLAAVLGRAAQLSIAGLHERTKDLEVEAERRREAEDTLRQAQKMEAVGQLTGGIAHDFNNILTIIIGNLDTLKRRIGSIAPEQDAAQLAAALTRPIDFALQGARSAAQLTHRLLAFSRQQVLAPARLDLNRTIADLSDMLRRSLGEKVGVETVLAGGIWPTLADANQLENALLNLAINARDAMPNGGKLTIETANAYLDEAYARRFGDVAAGQYVVLSVTDTGTGITPDLLKKVFEPFFTTKKDGRGSGLGLAMIHGFVKQSGGHVRIYSEVGQGTTVKIYLPRLVEAEGASSAPAAKPVAPGPLARAKDGETILAVEDNEGVRDYATSVLKDLGYTLLEAADAEAALRIFESGVRIDLLFTDVVLPGPINGRELANRVAATRAGLPVLFTTGYTRNAIVHGGRLDANVHLINKPYTQQDLAQKVRELLDMR